MDRKISDIMRQISCHLTIKQCLGSHVKYIDQMIDPR